MHPRFRGRACEAHLTLALIHGGWKLIILRELYTKGTLRTGELMRAVEGVAKNRLNQNLRELERGGIIRRSAFPGRVPRVEYSLSRRGHSLCTVIEALHRWGTQNRRFLKHLLKGRRP